MDESRVGHGSNTSRIFSIYDLLQMIHIYNFPIYFALEKYRYLENWISEKYIDICEYLQNPYAYFIYFVYRK